MAQSGKKKWFTARISSLQIQLVLRTEQLMSAHLVEYSTRLARATYRCFIVTSLYTAVHAAHIALTLVLTQSMANLFTRTLYTARIVHVCMQSQSWLRAVTCIRIIVYTICVSVNTQMVYTQYVCMYSLHGAKLGCVTYQDWLCASQSGASMH